MHRASRIEMGLGRFRSDYDAPDKRRESAGLSRAAPLSTGETDSPLEGNGFELSVPLL